MIVKMGKFQDNDLQMFTPNILELTKGEASPREILHWNGYTMVPLWSTWEEKRELIGILGLELNDHDTIKSEDQPILQTLSERIVTALQNRKLQSGIFDMLLSINPRVQQFQTMRAETRFANADELIESDFSVPPEVTNMVKDALTHFWGGPKLSDNPLLKLSLVNQAAQTNDQNPVNVLRGILRQAIDQVKPEGDRKYTGEWILYNILEMKFIQGKKVREVAQKLAMSEADLYRKQRVAIEAVAKAILDMENQVESK
jgi:hypothetical protein